MRWLLALWLLCTLPAAAEEVEVDLELFLAVDVSRSMTERELEIQRRGYAEALSSPEVAAAVAKGLLGRIALTYVEWAGVGSQRIIVDWTLIETPEDLRSFASQLTVTFDESLRRTSISSVIDYAAKDFGRNAFFSFRNVIDISGDGPNNAGGLVEPARDRAIAGGVVINGLPLMTREGLGVAWHLDDLDKYYEACVIGGPGAFLVPVRDWAQFPEAVRRKLVLEIAGLPPRLSPAEFHVPQTPVYDCLIGEKIWEKMREFYQTL